mmetsp:Transcript_59764/g.159944  ORF Transcript_59764/g.159944 Transcript_59764/m.159944 type:complete len:217 (-) Transcript_59764:1392-2042(-)
MARRRRRTGSTSRGHRISSTSQARQAPSSRLPSAGLTRSLPTVSLPATPRYARSSRWAEDSATLSPGSRSVSRQRPRAPTVAWTRPPKSGPVTGDARPASTPTVSRSTPAGPGGNVYPVRINPSMVPSTEAIATRRSSGLRIAPTITRFAVPTPMASSSQGSAICTTRLSALPSAGTRSPWGCPTASTARTASRMAKPLLEPSASWRAGTARWSSC